MPIVAQAHWDSTIWPSASRYIVWPEKVTGFPIVPTIVAILLKMQDLTQYDFSSLRYLTNTGAALPVEHIRRLRSMFPQVTMISMFGLTECKRVSYLPPEELANVASTPGTLEEALDALKNDHEFLLKGDVFTKDVIDTWIKYKWENEVDAIRLRPHPYEFALYYDI